MKQSAIQHRLHRLPDFGSLVVVQCSVFPILCETGFVIENPLMVALIAVAIIAVIVFFGFAIAKGRKAVPGTILDLHTLMQKTAKHLQLEYDNDPATHADLTDKLRQFSFTASHSAARFSRYLWGPVAQSSGTQRVHFFNFTSKQQREFTIRQTVLLVETATGRLPSLRLFPTRLADRFAEIAGAQDIDLPGDKEFSRKFSVKGADEMEIRVALTPALTGFFKDHPEFSFESSGDGSFLLYRDGCIAEGKTVEARQNAYGKLLDHGLQLASQIESSG